MHLTSMTRERDGFRTYVMEYVQERDYGQWVHSYANTVSHSYCKYGFLLSFSFIWIV